MKMYLGPYLRCKSPKKKVESKYQTCLTEGCQQREVRRQPGTQFCSACGQPLGWVSTEYEEDAVCPFYDVRPKIGSVFVYHGCVKSGNHIWIPYQWDSCPRVFWVDGLEEGVAHQLLSDKISGEMIWLANEYLDEIKKLRKIYGEDNVTGEWGLVIMSK